MVWLVAQTTVNPLPVHEHSNARIRFGMIRKHYPELLIGCAGDITFACRRDRFLRAIRGGFGLAYCFAVLSQSISAGGVTDVVFLESSRFWLGHAQDYNFEVACRGHREWRCSLGGITAGCGGHYLDEGAGFNQATESCSDIN